MKETYARIMLIVGACTIVSGVFTDLAGHENFNELMTPRVLFTALANLAGGAASVIGALFMSRPGGGAASQ